MTATQDPTGKLGPEPWITAPETVRVMNALKVNDADVRFVGGCVRDAIAKRPVKDIDIATPDKPETVIELLRSAGIRSEPTGIDHGTITAICDDRTFEITTLRKDVETFGRRAVVAFTDDWIVDSSRRDFTINAMSANTDGDVYDYHNGIKDLAHGQIRFIGNAEARVSEDFLRILRYFRFYGHYGRPPIDQNAFLACRKYAEKLSDISVERIRDEILKIVMAPDAADVFLLMRDAHVLDVILPNATEIGRLRAASWLATRGLVIDGMKPDPIRRLGAVLDPESDVSMMSSRLRLSNRESYRLSKMAELAPTIVAPLDEAATRKLIHSQGAESVQDATILAWASRLAEVARLPAEETAARLKQLEAAFSWHAPELPVSGADAQTMGLLRGPKIGRVLRAVEDWWSDGDFKADRDACLAKLQSEIEQISER